MNEVAIIGAGPAGIACAVQLARYGIIPLIFEQDIPGGLLKNANLVENFPGFPGGLSGITLTGNMVKQLELSGVPLIHEKVINVYYKTGKYRIITDKKDYSSDILVVASGTCPNEWQDVPIPLELTKSSFYEVYALRDVRDATIAIIGAGDAAFDYAMQLSSYNKVCIFNRSAIVKCLPILLRRAKSIEQISYHENYTLAKAEYEQSSSCLKLFFETKNGIKSHLADYIIFALGRRPELGFADPGLISLFEQLQQEKKLYLVGDVKNDLLRQASIAAGEGIRAAMQIYFNESNKKNLG
jgi:thioredoxin reductase